MPNTIAYNRQINDSPLIGKYFSFGDMMIIVFACIVLTGIAGSLLEPFLFCTFYFLYLLAFRIGRRPGYDVHLFRSLFTPLHLRLSTLHTPFWLRESSLPTVPPSTIETALKRHRLAILDELGVVAVARGKWLRADALENDLIDAYRANPFLFDGKDFLPPSNPSCSLRT
jgi:hypothetical protein